MNTKLGACDYHLAQNDTARHLSGIRA